MQKLEQYGVHVLTSSTEK